MKKKLLSKLSIWLKDISNDSPCGEDFVESSFEYPSFASNVDSAVESTEWKKLKQEADDYLVKTKDIRLYVAYTRILIHTEKSPLLGLSKGLQLVHHCIENYWDCFYPKIDEEESDPLEAILDRTYALANFSNVGDFILPLSKRLTILSIGLGDYTLEDLVTLDAGGSVSDKQPLQGLMPEEEKAYEEVLQYFRLSLEIAENIKTLYCEKTNEVFSEFNALLEILKKGAALGGGGNSSSEAGIVPMDNSGGDGSQMVAPTMQIQGTINNRKDIIKALGLICEYYETNEPSSPVPLMLERVTKMVDMNYREIFAEFQLGADSTLDKVFGQATKK